MVKMDESLTIPQVQKAVLMTDLAVKRNLETNLPSNRIKWARQWGPVTLTVMVVLLVGMVVSRFANATTETPLLVNSTLGQLGVWMSAQSEEEAPESILGQYAKDWAARSGAESLDVGIILAAMQNGMMVFISLSLALLVAGVVGLFRSASWSRMVLMLALLSMDVLLFLIPSLEGDNTLSIVLFSIFLLLAVLLFAEGRVTKTLGFVVVLSALLMTWEVFKGFAQAVDFRMGLPESNWTYTTYPTLDDALLALENGETVAVVADSKELAPLMLSTREAAEAVENPAYPNLRMLDTIQKDTSRVALPIIPAFPGRLTVAVRAADVANWQNVSELIGQPVGAVAASFADEKLLAQPRSWVLLDLSIGNDLNMPHLQKIAEALLQPARRNGPMLLLRILINAAQFTWSEAVMGFTAGAILGFLLGTLFAHSRLMERGLLPYVVASQTIPLLAIAPMVVIWLGANPLSVAVISAYLTFFPVTINTLRGLQSPHPTALELMQSYAASRWTIMWKLRFPAALPYIFTALKVSATASVVGAIIGELPSGIGDGLGRAILDFNQYYTSDPAKLWAAIFIAALVGMVFFLSVVILERLVMPAQLRSE